MGFAEFSEKVRGINGGIIFLAIFAAVFSVSLVGQIMYTPVVIESILKHNRPNDTEEQISGTTSFYKSVVDGGAALLCFFLLPSLGGLSDTYGRKFVLGLSAASMSISLAFYMIAFYFKWTWLIFASIIFIFMRGATMVAGLAFASDLADEEHQKAQYFGVAVGASMAGNIGGAIATGYLGQSGDAASIYIPLGALFLLSLVNLVYLFFGMKETMTTVKEFSWNSMNPLRSLKTMFLINRYVACLLVVYAIFNIALADTNVYFLYGEHRYGWYTKMNGYLTAATSASTIAWQVIGLGFMIKFMTESTLLITWFFMAFVIHFTFGLAPWGWLFMVLNALSGIGNGIIPVIDALISKQVSKDDQGILFGGLGSLMYLSAFLGSLFIENSFSLCLHHSFFSCPGTPFYLGAILLGLCGVLTWFIVRHFGDNNRKRSEYQSLSVNELSEP